MLGIFFEALLTLFVPMGKGDKPASPAVLAFVLFLCVAFVVGLFVLAYSSGP